MRELFSFVRRRASGVIYIPENIDTASGYGLKLQAAGESWVESRGRPRPQKSVSSVARQKARGPGSLTGCGALRVQSPARAHHAIGISP